MPVKITYNRDGLEISRETADVPPEAVLDALADVAEVVLNA